MADQQRRVSLVFEANANQAKQEINGLMQSLQKLQSMPATTIDSRGIREANKAAMELQGHLQKAINVDTGKLDLSRFTASLTNSGKTLQQYANTLTRIGPAGDTAFKSLISQINKSEVSTLRLTKGMRDFITTMKNTVKWQISSNIMHGFMGAIQTAMGYAQELDASLNNIRIVTGQTTEEMAKFATQANKAAQALSTTTTKYTDAALIFYQQGLSDQIVKERTEAVIKMANVTGEAAKDVSSYMTAIWNNFSDGSKSIEYYADVITKLGAATAASSEEIAGGLEKFAAIANTIGLSYEYATSMITTIVDKTRQSEDVVGTALKTILARIQGLSLGDTLEDGTDLNKYSKALASVGISIKTTSGELKGMDQILDDLGSKWGTFSKDTQIALAQVVGGVRQYNQILALMDNWTSFEQNVKLAETSSGSLDEQADIYAESWEASSRRVKNAAQGIYDALIDEKAFTQLNNIFSVLLNGVEGLVEGFGGLMPLLGTLGGFIAQKFAKEMPGALKGMRENFMILTGRADKQAINQQVQANEITRARMVDTAVSNPALSAEYETLLRIGKMKENLLRNQHQMTAEQIKSYELAIQNEEVAGEQYQARAKELAILEEQTAELKEQAAVEAAHRQAQADQHPKLNTNDSWKDKKTEAEKQVKAQTENLRKEWEDKGTKANRKKEIEKELAGLGVKKISSTKTGHTKVDYDEQHIRTLAQDLYETEAKDRLGKVQDTHNKLAQTKAINQEAKRLKTEFATDPGADLDQFKTKMTQVISAFETAGVNVDELKQKFDVLNNSSEITEQQLDDLEVALDEVEKSVGETAREARKSATEYGISSEAVNAAAKQGTAQGEHTYKGARADRDIPEIPQKTISASEKLTEAVGTLFSVYSSVVAISTAWNTVLDDNATGMEKAGAVIGALVSVMGSFNSVASLLKTLQITSIPVTYEKAKADMVAAGASAGLATSIRAVGASIMAIPGIGWILGIAAALTAAVVAIGVFNNRLTDSEKRIKTLTERTEALNKAQQILEQHSNDVQSAWDNYQDVTEALEACTVGTDKWNEALLKCNQSVLSLISTAPALARYVQYNADGTMSLGGLEYEQYVKELNQKSMALQAASLIASNEVKQIELSDKYDFRNAEAYSQLSKLLSDNPIIIEEGNEEAALTTLVEYIKQITNEDKKAGIEMLEQLLGYQYGTAQYLYTAGSAEATGDYLDAEGYSKMYKYLSDFNAAHVSWNSYEKSSKAAYSAIFGALENYEVDNLSLYGDEISDLLETRKADSSTNYHELSLTELAGEMAKVFGGEVEDYSELSEDSMRYSLILEDITSNTEILNGIITEVNTTLSEVNSVGQSLVRNGNLAGASYADLQNSNLSKKYITPKNIKENPLISSLENTSEASNLNAVIQPFFDALAEENYDSYNAAIEAYQESSSSEKSLWGKVGQFLFGEAQPFEDELDEVRSGIKNLKGYTDEEVDSIIEDLKDGEIDFSNYALNQTYRNYIGNISAILEQANTTISDFLNEEEEVLTNLTTKQLAQKLNERLPEIQDLANKSQELLLAQVFGLEGSTGEELFRQILGEGYQEGNYAVNYEKARNKALEKLEDPEALYRANVLSAVGIDAISADKYAYDAQNLKASQEQMVKFAKKFNILTDEEIEEGISWEKIQQRLRELVVENSELQLAAWNNSKSARFRTSELEVNDEGRFVLKEGASGDNPVDELIQGLQNAGASTQVIDAYMKSINSIGAGLTTAEFRGITTSFTSLIKGTGDAGKAIDIFNRILLETQANGKALSEEELAAIAEEAGISTNDLKGAIQVMSDTAASAVDSITSLTRSFDTLQGTLEALQGLIGITTGSEIDKDDYEKMRDAIPEEYRDLFMRTANGYTFYGTEEQGKEIERLSREGVWNDYADRYEKVQEAGAGVDGLGKATSGDIDTKWIQGQMADAAFIEFLESTKMLGAGRLEALQNLTQEQWSDQEALNQPEIKEGLDQAIAATIRYLADGFSHLTDEEAQMQLTGIRSTDELQMAVTEGRIKVGEGEGEIAAAQLQAYGRSLWSGELEEIDIDFKEVEELAKHLKELPEYAKASEDSLLRIAKAQLRWNRSVEAGEKGLEDWKKQLKTVTKDGLGNFADSIEDVQAAYGDLLDIDSKHLSTDFLTNAENMTLYEKAIYGSIEAYRELQKVAADDIYTVGLEGAGEALELIQRNANQAFTVGVSEEAWDGAIGEVRTLIDEMNANAEITPTVQLGEVNKALSDLKFDSYEAAMQATKSLSAIGVNAKIVPQTVHVPEKRVVTKASGRIPVGPTATIKDVDYEYVVTTEAHDETFYTLQGEEFTPTAFPSNLGGSRASRRGGSRGGGSRAPRAETKKDTEKERYHTVNNQLEDLTDSYDKVSKAADRAFGGAKVKLIRDQIKAVQDLSATQGKYLKEIENYYKFDKDNLSQVSAYVGFDVQLDENGTITNFDAIQDAMFSAYNKNINEKGEVIGMDEEAWKAYEQEWERIMALIEQYEETQDLRKEALQQLQDYINEIYDLQLQEISYSVEIDIDVSDYGLEILDYMLKRVEDDAWKAVETIATLGEQTAEWAKQNETYSKGIRDILMERTKDIYDSNGNKLQDAQLTEADVNAFLNGEDKALEKVKTLNLTDEEVQTLKEYMSNLLKINTTLTELRENVFATVLESFQSFAEELDDTIDKMKVLNEMTNTYRNIIDIVGKKNLGISNGLYASLGQANIEQQMDQVASSRYKAESMRANLDAAKAKLAEYESAGMTAEAELMRKNIKEMEKDTLEAEQNFLSTWENALSAAREQFELEMGIVIDTMSDALAGPLYTSLQQLQEAFDRKNTNAKLHLADYEKIYELNKLNRDIEKSMDETASIQGKQALADLQAEINALEEEGVQISQYQSEDLRRRYELRLAEMALMEAQNAKSEVRMTRDSDGNWNYVYTADSEKVAEAEQNYEDRLYALQQSNAEYIEELQSKLVQAQIEMGEKIAEIRADQTLSVEEQNALIDEIMAHYNEQFNFYTSELELALDNNRELYETDWKNYSDLTGYKISADEDYLDKFTETQLSILTGFKSFDEYKSNYLASTNDMMKSMSTALDNYIANSKGIFEAAGTAYTDFADLVGENVTTITEHSERLRKDTEEKAAQTQVEFEKILESVEEWTAKYSALIDDTISKNLDLVNSYKELLEMLGEVKEESPEGEPPVIPEENTPKEEPKTQPSEPEAPKRAPSIHSGGRVKASSGAKIYDYAGAQGESQLFASDPKYRVLQIQGDWVQVRHHSLSSGVSGWFKRGDLTAYDTGGYTGAWGPDGRLAMLHEKEIILNKDDSKNFLSAINMVRQVAEIIDLNAYASAGFGNRIAAYGVPNSTGTLEQQVHITAEFPNATDKNEIYEAFNEILNLATQYAGRK